MDKQKSAKVGIVTVHKNTNFGANLQAFALNKYINNSGFNCETIDYVPDDRHNHLFSWLKLSWDGEPNKTFKRKLKLGAALLLSAGWKHKRLSCFQKFRKNNMRISPFCKTAEDIAKLGFDTIVCGSDQIWSPNNPVLHGIDHVFWGDVEGINKKVSYAASIGRSSYEPEQENEVAELVKKMDSVSLREEDSAKYIASISGKETACVCDPVFLLDKDEYLKIIGKRKEKGRYVLVYSIVSNPEMMQIAEKYAENNGLKLIELCQWKEKVNHKQLPGYGPKEFLNLFYYADTIFTNSFHGAAFSIVFAKEFFAVNNINGGSRITNLLNKAGIGDRLIDKYPDNVKPLDYNAVKENMKEYIENSKEFLDNALSN